MNSVDDIIADLARETNEGVAPLPRPSFWIVRLLVVFAAYGTGTVLFLEPRPDLSSRLMNPWYAAEIFALTALATGSLAAAIASMFPDNYQRRSWFVLPYLLATVLLMLLGAEAMFAPAATALSSEHHTLQCTICITCLAIIPSLLLFYIIARGASIHPLHAGAMTVLASGTLGCLALRLAEANDDISHLMLFHYLPIFLLSALGAYLGKKMLSW